MTPQEDTNKPANDHTFAHRNASQIIMNLPCLVFLYIQVYPISMPVSPDLSKKDTIYGKESGKFKKPAVRGKGSKASAEGTT